MISTRFRFNRAIAHIRELTNAIEAAAAADGAGVVLREAIEIAVRLLGPMMPHLGEELWQALGHGRLLADEPWPKADPALAREETVTLAVQVNGKLRGTVDLPRDVEDDAARAAALALPGGAAPARRPGPAQDHHRAQPDRQCRRLNATR